MVEQGTVVEISGQQALIMSSTCQFRWVEVSGQVRLGDLVDYSSRAVNPYPIKRMAALAACLILFTFISLAAYQYLFVPDVYAYVALDINPSLELGLDRELQVVQVNGFNDEGESLIKNTPITRTRLEDSLDNLFEQCLSKNYLKPGENNHIGVSICLSGSDDPAQVVALLEDIMAKRMEKNSLDATVYFLVVDESTRTKASGNSLSPMRYLIKEKAEETGSVLDLNRDSSFFSGVVNEIASAMAFKSMHYKKGAVSPPGNSQKNTTPLKQDGPGENNRPETASSLSRRQIVQPNTQAPDVGQDINPGSIGNGEHSNNPSSEPGSDKGTAAGNGDASSPPADKSTNENNPADSTGPGKSPSDNGSGGGASSGGGGSTGGGTGGGSGGGSGRGR